MNYKYVTTRHECYLYESTGEWANVDPIPPEMGEGWRLHNTTSVVLNGRLNLFFVWERAAEKASQEGGS